jgi:hypothetical protein
MRKKKRKKKIPKLKVVDNMMGILAATNKYRISKGIKLSRFAKKALASTKIQHNIKPKEEFLPGMVNLENIKKDTIYFNS